MNPPSSITKTFVTNDKVLDVTFTFTYEEAAPQPKLKTVAATIIVHPEMSQEPIGALKHSPPADGTTISIRLKGETPYDFQQAGMQVQGSFRLQPLQSTGGVWMDVRYGTDQSHFEGITVLFQWVLT